MKTDLKLLFFIKRTEVKENETCPIMGRINIGRTVAQFSTKLNVSVSLWDTRANRASGKSTKAVEINRALDTISVSVHSHYQWLTGLHGNVTPTEVKNAFQGIASTQETILDYFARHNKEFAKRVWINREKTTAEQYEISRNHLARFIRKKYNVSDIPFSKPDLSFIEAFDFYLKVELKRMPNTILGIVRHVRKMIKLAIGEGIISCDPFEGYEPERPKAQQKYLTREEFDRIMTTQLETIHRVI